MTEGTIRRGVVKYNWLLKNFKGSMRFNREPIKIIGVI